MIKPLNGNVVLKKELKENKTASGIYLSQKQEEDYGIVVSFSEDETIKGLKIGDKVVYKSYDSKKVVDNGEEYLIMPYKDILAVID
ncbi:MAG: co-chaperone GroES [Candidatus Onthovivens sp.]|nr:co-chaperone GroES [Mollicutes bacterium]MDD7622252.1 co-chaperone GroES [Bacilli bacterium]